AINDHVLDRSSQSFVEAPIDVVKVVEAAEHTVGWPGGLVIGDLEATDRWHNAGDRFCRPGARADPRTWGWERRGDGWYLKRPDERVRALVADHGRWQVGHRAGTDLAGQARQRRFCGQRRRRC